MALGATRLLVLHFIETLASFHTLQIVHSSMTSRTFNCTFGPGKYMSSYAVVQCHWFDLCFGLAQINKSGTRLPQMTDTIDIKNHEQNKRYSRKSFRASNVTLLSTTSENDPYPKNMIFGGVLKKIVTTRLEFCSLTHTHTHTHYTHIHTDKLQWKY